MLKVGDKIPTSISVKNSKGDSVTLQDYLDQDYLVIYFYPKDDTPGCTTQACGFRDATEDIENLGAKIIGVSKDSPESHVKFAQKHDLNFILISDEDAELTKAFGVWVERSMFGNKFMGTQRSCFIVDKGGKIVKVWEKASPKNNASEVLKFLQKRQA